MFKMSKSINNRQFVVDCIVDNETIKLIYETADKLTIALVGKLPANKNIKDLVNVNIDKQGFIGYNAEDFIIASMIETFFTGQLVTGEPKWRTRSAVINNEEEVIHYLRENDKLLIKQYLTKTKVDDSFVMVEGYLINGDFTELNKLVSDNRVITDAAIRSHLLESKNIIKLLTIYKQGVDFPDETGPSVQMVNNLRFGDVVQRLTEGQKFARKGWNGKDMFIYYVPKASYPAQTGVAKSYYGDTALVPYNAYIAIKNVDGTVSTWTPSINDCLADDWYQDLSNKTAPECNRCNDIDVTADSQGGLIYKSQALQINDDGRGYKDPM